MKTTTFLLYTFFSLIVISCFAALAKYQLGFYGIAFGTLIFALIFLFLMIRVLTREKTGASKWIGALELFGLALFAVVMFLKAYQLLFLGITWLHVLAVLILLVVIVLRVKTWVGYKDQMPKSLYVLNTVILICYTLFLVTDLVWQLTFSAPIMPMAVLILVGIIPLIYMAAIRTYAFLKEGKKIITLDVELFRGYWLYLGYILIFSYQVASQSGFVDSVEFKRLPPEYVDLFYKAESGEEEPVDGTYGFELYIREYKALMSTKNQ